MERSNNNRPKITLTIPQYNQHGGYMAPQQTAGITTAGIPPQYVQPGVGGYAAGYNPFASMYPQKAGEFMFKQFSGFRDFTMNTAKSGLSVGEKSAFWLYNKVSKWSRKWFTHIFLFLVVLCYSLAGASIFVAVEGTHEETLVADIRRERYELVKELREMAGNKELMLNSEKWEGSAIAIIRDFEGVLYDSFKNGIRDSPKKIWSFWNSMFYCGTIYTTIEKSKLLSLNEIAAQVFVFFLGGFETSSVATSFTLYELAKNPDIQKRLQREVDEVIKKNGGKLSYDCLEDFKYLRQVFDEALRKYPPVPILQRTVTIDYKLPNTNIILKKGEELWIPTFAMHRDPKFFNDPMKFDPDRFSPERKAEIIPYTYLPFGEGPRNCIGMRQGFMQGKLGIAAVMADFDVGFSVKGEPSTKLNPAALFEFEDGLNLKFTKRSK